VRTTSLQGRDAIAAATALNQAMAVIVTTDADFAQIPGLQAVTPTQALGLLETGG
jgi:predicted nucleic acid-binding protein